MQFHPIASIYPLIESGEFQDLVADISARGLFEDITVYQEQILDGRNRWMACEAASVEPRYREFEGTPIEAVRYVVSLNDKRRHLTPSQRAGCEYRQRELVAEYGEAVAEMEVEAKESQGTRTDLDDNLPETLQEGSKSDREVATQRATASGTNAHYIYDMKEIGDKRPDAVDAIIKGEKSVPQVKREIRKAENLDRVRDLPPDTYRVFYADPPWSYGNSGIIGDSDHYGHTGRHYPSMTIAELCDLGIASIADDDAVLFLWVTSPLLAEVWPVIKAWGFTYKTSFVWDKEKHNFGHYNSVRHELLLVCTKGSCTPDVPTLYDSVQNVERSDTHSEKPQVFRDIIDDLYPYGKRLELFARAEHDNWERWGSE